MARAPIKPRKPDPGPDLLRRTIRDCLRLTRPARRLIASPKRIHQLRIATRRAQCAALILEPRLTPDLTSALTDPLRKLRRAAGRARDTHIRINLIKQELKPLDKSARRIISSLNSRHDDDLNRLRKTAKRRRARLADALKRAESHLAAAGPAFDELAARALRTTRAECTALAHADLNDPPHLHRLRRALKRLRYTIELAGPQHKAGLHRPITPAAQLKALARLQDTLGQWNDLRITLDSLPALDQDDKPTPARRRLQRRVAAAQARAIRAVRAWDAGPRSRKLNVPAATPPPHSSPPDAHATLKELGAESPDEFRLQLATARPDGGTAILPR
ncbi:MAG: CHAD domain-containing protein [Phycisphaerales bacterium]|nr:CHAD domain-containing protein [Phycisphaerales bacterium]